MLEKVGNKDIIVRNYTSNFDVKEYIQEVLIPKAFPTVPMNKLNLGFTGVASEMIAQAIEDSYATTSLMLNESFITRAVLPSSIYSAASLFNIGYNFAVPSRCSFAIQLNISDIIRYSEAVQNTMLMRYVLDKDTKIILGDNIYRFDYDVIIDHEFIDGKRVYNIYYDMSETNSMSIITNKYIKHQTSSSGWLILFVDLRSFDRKVETNSLTDNLIATNSDVTLRWTNQIAGIDLIYISPQGQRLPMKLKTQYTKADIEPFVWYKFNDDNTMILSFSSNNGYWTPDFNSKIESTIYTCNGTLSNFDSYDNKTSIPVQKSGERYSYNADTQMVALCYSGSTGGMNRGDIENLRDQILLAYNTANVLTTDRDLKMWFDMNAQRYGSKSTFFKRRDDPCGRLFSQFIAITDNTYIYPTNTLTMEVDHNQFDYINNDSNGINKEFIIKPGHLWEYADYVNEHGEKVIVRDRVRMISGMDGMAMVTDDALPIISENRPFMFVNPFFIKIYRDPMVSMNYNYLINHTSWPEDIPINTGCFYQFQLSTFSIERTLSNKYNNMYHIEVICVPVITTNTSLKYIEGIGEDYPVGNNNMRLVLITRSALDGETGYIEMTPTEIKNGGAILFETDIAVYDNINSDLMIEIDMERTPSIVSLITNGPRQGKVYIDSSETSFHFAVMMKDTSGKLITGLYNNPSFSGYVMANRFANSHRELNLYKPLSMMKSTITFEGENNNYKITSTLNPFLRYDIPLDDSKMNYFIRAFGDQYSAMEPVIDKLDGNSFLDIKLYNTYGRSNNYYIGPKDGETALKDSDILLDNVYVNIKLRISVYDRSMYVQTVNDVINQITSFFDTLNSDSTKDIHVSEIIHVIRSNIPNVRYIRFIGFNNYDANKQSIFVKYTDISELRQDQLQPHVPEIIRVDSSSIEILEEI